MQVSAIRAALAAAITANVTSTPPLIALPYVPDSIVAPCIYTDDVQIDFDRAHKRGMDEITFVMRLLVSRTDDRYSQQLLDGYLDGSGAASVKAGLEAARHNGAGGTSLGGVCDDFHVKRVRGYRWYTHAEAKYIGAEFTVQVIGEGA